MNDEAKERAFQTIGDFASRIKQFAGGASAADTRLRAVQLEDQVAAWRATVSDDPDIGPLADALFGMVRSFAAVIRKTEELHAAEADLDACRRTLGELLHAQMAHAASGSHHQEG